MKKLLSIISLVLCFAMLLTSCGDYSIIPKGEPATEADVEAFNNAMANTLNTDDYSSNISVSFKVLSWVTAEIKLTGTLDTADEQTNGSATLSIMDESNSCTYEYPVYNRFDVPYARLMLENGKYIYIPKDFASLGDGIVVNVPDSAISRLQILNSEGTSYVAEIKNEEITAMYGKILDFFVDYASDFDIDLGTLSFYEAYVQAESNGDYFDSYKVFMQGSSKKGTIEVSMNINIIPND